jgi:hypothetical protein
MPIRKGNHSKRRYMYFRGDSKRDIRISQKEEQEKYDSVICQYCKECMDKYELVKGKIPRKIGKCGICGKDGFVCGSLFSKDDGIVFARMYKDFEGLGKADE